MNFYKNSNLKDALVSHTKETEDQWKQARKILAEIQEIVTSELKDIKPEKTTLLESAASNVKRQQSILQKTSKLQLTVEQDFKMIDELIEILK
jgi:hypothetical protein